MIYALDRLFVWMRACPVFYRSVIFTRVLLAAGFIPTGMVKALGQRFTVLSTETPVGAFFEAMHQTGPYWRFLGLSQIIAGVLLLIPRFAHLGAAIFLPIMLNIFIITLSIDFKGTPFITGMMLLATSFLCFWDFHRFRPMLTTDDRRLAVPAHRLDTFEFAGFAVFALALLSFFAITRGLMPAQPALAIVAIGFAAGLFTLCRFLWILRRPTRAAPATCPPTDPTDPRVPC